MTHLITSTCSAQRTHNSGSSCTGWLQQQGSVRTLYPAPWDLLFLSLLPVSWRTRLRHLILDDCGERLLGLLHQHDQELEGQN